MPTMAELLSDAQAARLNEIQFPSAPLAQPGATDLTRTCVCDRRHDGMRREGDVMVHKACGRPMPETALLRGASAVPVTVPCGGGCGSQVTVATRKTDVTDGQPRLAVCVTCARAMSEGSPVTVLASPPKSAPIGVTTTKEIPVPKVDLDAMSSAQLGETIKRAERERLAADLPAKRKKAKDKEAKRDKAQAKAKRAERKTLIEMGVLPAFMLLGVEVPALDVAGLANLAETPNAKARSPYNKVRYREGLPLLHHLDEPGIGQEACTWATLVAEHQRMLTLAQEQPKAKGKGKKKQAQIAAPIDLDERVKVEAIMSAVGCSEKKARKILAGV